MTAAQEPTNHDAEACVVGSMLLSVSALDEARELVEARDFHDSAARTVFDAICAMRDRNDAVDEVTVGAELTRRGHLTAVGGHLAIHGFVHRVPTAANVSSYARAVADCAARRRAVDAGTALALAAQDPTVDLDRALRLHQADLEDVDLVAADLRQIDEIDEVAVERILARDPQADRGVDVGWPTLDRHYRVPPGLLTVVTGTPNAGKSTLLDALTLALAARHGWRFVMFSPENAPTDDHAAQLARAFGGQPLHQVRSEKAAERLRWVGKHYTWLRSTDGVTVEDLLRRADALWRRQRFQGLGIDPWNELDHSRASHVTETQHISQSLTLIRRWARRRQVHVWIVAHPRKQERQRDGSYRAPTLYEIAASATWFDKADLGLVVHRDQLNSAAPTEVHVVKVRFARHGSKKVIDVFYDEVGDTLGPDRPQRGQEAF